MASDSLQQLQFPAALRILSVNRIKGQVVDSSKIETDAHSVYTLLGEKLGARGKDLSQRIRRAGRLLPRHLRAEATYLAKAAEWSRSPRLIKRIDQARVRAAHRSCVQYLEGVDRRERRKRLVVAIWTNFAVGIFLMLVFLVAAYTFVGGPS